MKNICTTVVILAIFVISTMSSSVLARISSRIEGIVTDKDTGDPIPKAWVLLYRVDEGIVKSTQTDNKGYFQFGSPPVFAGREYFIRSTAPGYAQHIPEYYFEYVKPEYFDEIFRPFRIEEGQIKHIRINLEKGGSLKGVLFKKDSTDISPFKGVTVFLRKKKKPHEYFLKDTNDKERFRLGYTKTDELGEFTFHELEPSCDSIQDEYIIKLDKFGYYLPRNICIKITKGIENQFEYTVDLTNLPELKGKITINGEPPIRGEVVLDSELLKNSDENFFLHSQIDKNGNYFFKGIPPGIYEIDFYCIYSDSKSIDKTQIFEIKEGQTNVFNINFEVKR